jgi:hypothetical protein
LLSILISKVVVVVDGDVDGDEEEVLRHPTKVIPVSK